MCHAVMYKQLSAWLLHGLLLDCYDEFFIMVKTATTNTGQILSPDEKVVETEDGKNEEKQLKVCVDLHIQEKILSEKYRNIGRVFFYQVFSLGLFFSEKIGFNCKGSEVSAPKSR